jgi:hypothetical protein
MDITALKQVQCQSDAMQGPTQTQLRGPLLAQPVRNAHRENIVWTAAVRQNHAHKASTVSLGLVFTPCNVQSAHLATLQDLWMRRVALRAPGVGTAALLG